MRSAAIYIVAIGLFGSGLATGPAVADDLPSGQYPQTISIAHIPNTTVDTAVVVDASATSMLDVDISATGACTMQPLPGGSQILATGPGACTVTADQPGDERWLPAPTVQQVFQFIGGNAGVTISNAGPDAYMAAQGLPLTITVQVASDDLAGRIPTGTVTGQLQGIPGGPTCLDCQPIVANVDTAGHAQLQTVGGVTSMLAPGAYVMALEYSGDDFYAGGRLLLTDVHIVPPGDAYGSPGTPMIVSIGDSYISGEGGRWAGNAFAADEAWRTDTNPNTYNDLGGYQESIPGCHRSASAEINIEQAGADVLSVNLACSGAETATDATHGDFKPGFDYYQDEARGLRSQTLELYRLASANPGRIKMVVLSIGGNDFHFGPIVKVCVQNFVLWSRKCSRLPEVQQYFDTPNVERQLANIAGALRNINDAMTEAGYTPEQWTLVQQDYPSPVPGEASKIRYPETLERVTAGGCGLYNADLAYANDTMLATINRTVERAGNASGLTNVKFLDLKDAYVGNRLCEKGVDLVGARTDVSNWTEPGAVLGSEWVASVRVTALAVDGRPYWMQESMHPSYWGQLANQVCVKLAWNSGDVQGGSCVRAKGANDAAGSTNRTYPRMSLVDE